MGDNSALVSCQWSVVSCGRAVTGSQNLTIANGRGFLLSPTGTITFNFRHFQMMAVLGSARQFSHDVVNFPHRSRIAFGRASRLMIPFLARRLRFHSTIVMLASFPVGWSAGKRKPDKNLRKLISFSHFSTYIVQRDLDDMMVDADLIQAKREWVETPGRLHWICDL
jgi:hypothetical protein